MKKILLLAVMILLSTLISGCGETAYIRPKTKTIKPKLKQKNYCGEIRAKRKDGYATLPVDKYQCLITKMKRCAYNNKVLLIAQKANEEQMK